MSLPSFWTFALLTLAAWRVWTLLAMDKVLDPVRDRLLITSEGEPRDKIIEFLECPYCAGFWCSLAATLTWWVGSDADWDAGIVITVFAVSAALVAYEAFVSVLQSHHD